MRLLYHGEDGEPSVTADLVSADATPPYAILSHTWGADDEEVTFHDLVNNAGKDKPGYKKIQLCGEQAKQDNLQYFWVDTCCINKANKAEHSLAIQSMFRWYHNAARCYVYLSDVSASPLSAGGEAGSLLWDSEFRGSKWFTRGWTLPELLAPSVVEFYSREWNRLGNRASLKSQIHEVTTIPYDVLEGAPLSQSSIDERFRWRQDRHTKLKEDGAYCLSGLFDVDIAPVYGEGTEEAFRRLHDKIRSQEESVQQREECLRDLRPTDPRNDKKRIEDTKGGLLEGSYRWVLDNSSFQQWQNDPQSQLLWIKGDPGKGKTMLLCGIIDELQKAVARTTSVSYFFCQATDSRINSATAVLRGLLYLLVTQQPALTAHVRKRYDQAGKAVFEDANAWIVLTEIFADVLQDPDLDTTYILVDALDECTTDMPKLLHFVAQQSSMSSRVKWIVSSRNWPDIEAQLGQAGHKVRLSLELNAASVSAAVSVFIQHKVSQLAQQKKYDKPTQDVVSQHLTSNANDSFLWVALVCQDLEKTANRNVLVKLNSFPPGLDALYEQMMAHVSAQDAETVGHCRSILRAITIASRPLQLRELAVAASLPRDQFGDLQAVLDLISRCGSFLKVREGVVSFIHPSARDYFTIGNGRRADPPNDRMTVPTYDSSVGSRRSQDLSLMFDSSSHGREGDSSTLPTSSGTTQLDVQADKQTRGVEYDDARTTYSVDSARDDLEKDYIWAFARRLLQDVENASGMTDISKIPSSYISDTLRAFSWRLHHESSNPFQWGTSVTLHRKRAHIIAVLTSQETSEVRPEQDNDSASGDDGKEGEEADRQPFVKTEAMYHEWLDGVLNYANDGAEETSQYQRADEEYLPQIPDYEAFIGGSEAYRWLVTKICQHERLAFAENDAMSKIGSTIRDELRTQEPLRKMSHRAPLSSVEIHFKLDWHPGLVLEGQKLTNTTSNVLDIILCITGSYREAQALTVSEYIRQTWPVTGEAVLSLFTQLLCLPQDHQNTRYMQKTKDLQLTALLDTPHSCVISVVADIYCVSEVAEQIAWLAATLQSPSRNQIIAARFPRLRRATAASAPAGTSTTKVAAVYVIRFEYDEETEDHEDNGLCWSSLFLNVNIVGGYPILRRPQPNTGLEISLSTLAYLVRSDQIVQCGRRIMMKGFNSLVIATFVTSSVVLWHLLVSSEPSERISYFDNRQDALRVIESDVSSLRMLENARHIIGWCPNVAELCGHKTANRMISTSGLTKVPSSIVIDRIYLEGGMYAIAGMNMRFNQKEDPIRLLEDRDYPSLLKWIAAQPIVFFDTSSLDRRAWLVDGASALLHLVRVSLHRDEMDDESTFEWVFDASALKDDWPGCTGRQAAIKTLKSFDNLNLKVYVEKRVGPVAQFSTLRDRVMNVLHAMEILIDTQQREAAKGEIRTLQTLDRRKFITGFDILDAIEPFGSINTRIARFDSWGDGWIDFLPSIGATTFFGQGFGDLVLPTDLHSVCTHWKTVPTRNDYLCASVSTLKMLYEKRLRRSGSTLGVGELTDKILWTSPSRPFDTCSCLRSQTSSDHKHCDPVQFLVTSPKAWRSKLTLKDSAPIDLTTLDDTGAVVFANLGLLGRRVSVRAEASIVEGAASISAGSSVSQSMSVASTSATASEITPPTGTTNTTDTNNTIRNTISLAGRDSMGEAARIMPKQKAKGRMDKLLGIFKRGSSIRERRS